MPYDPEQQVLHNKPFGKLCNFTFLTAKPFRGFVYKAHAHFQIHGPRPKVTHLPQASQDDPLCRQVDAGSKRGRSHEHLHAVCLQRLRVNYMT
jgi:hypothetical protein